MQKFFTPKAFVLFTFLFVGIAAVSFAAFQETEQVSNGVKSCCKTSRTTKSGGLFWEVVSRQFFTLLSI